MGFCVGGDSSTEAPHRSKDSPVNRSWDVAKSLKTSANLAFLVPAYLGGESPSGGIKVCESHFLSAFRVVYWYIPLSPACRFTYLIRKRTYKHLEGARCCSQHFVRIKSFNF